MIFKILRPLPIFLLLACLPLFSGCAAYNSTMQSLGLSSGHATPTTPKALALDAMDNFNRGEYDAALKKFNDIRDRFPFSKAGLLAELKSADCEYYLQRYPEAIALYNDFASNHPTNEAIPYVIFQIGISYYKQIGTIDRDPGSAKSAITTFAKLIKEYPQSPYIVEAKSRRLAALNFLANHEFYVANFYVRTDELTEAVGRYKYLIKKYPESSVAGKAKEIIAAIKSGNPPRRTWRDWLPDLSLPDWHTFSNLNPGT
ncbi:MAG: outer membrane protein assembly factor BamD, partial [Deltaproteobacteria bacterium]|nr:outer membrane protein assembly factor BamD [Deltaproteobacteria bacterium]